MNSKKQKIGDVAISELHGHDSDHRSFPICQSNQQNFVIHNCLTNEMAKLEDSLQILLDSYPEAPYTFSDDGYLPIHLACIYHSENLKVVDMIMTANPSAVVEPVSVSSFAASEITSL